MKTKICSKCKKIRRIENFNKDKTHRDGLQSRCKFCRNIWRVKNKAKLRKRAKIYYDTHQDKIKSTYYSPAGIYTSLKARAKHRNIIFDINKVNFINWYENQKQICHYCSRTLKEINQIKFGRSNKLTIDRKDNNKGYTLDNIVLACMRCNHIKSDYFTEQEMLRIGGIIMKKEVTQ
jgi:5-methylcytosine-specific restriction endonuclease McrA